MPFQVSPGVNVTEIDLTTIVPAVSTTEGAIGGVFRWGPVEDRDLISTEDELALRFGKPDDGNFETFYTAANFLAYGNKLYVSRAASSNTYNAVVISNTSPVVSSNTQIKNYDHYDTINFTTDEDDLYYAKWPGDLGNTLKISVCDSANAYQKTIDLTTASAELGFVVGSLTAYLRKAGSQGPYYVANATSDSGFTSGTTGAFYPLFLNDDDAVAFDLDNGGTGSASTFTFSDAGLSAYTFYMPTGDLNYGVANTDAAIAAGYDDFETANLSMDSASVNAIVDDLEVGDYIEAGSTSLGYQSLKIEAIDSSNTDNVVITLQDRYFLSENVNMANTFRRQWEYFDFVDTVPGTSQYALDRGGVGDELHIVVVDEDGKISGTPGTILEVFPGLSRAQDARGTEGGTIYYKDYINQSSRWIWFANDRAGAPSLPLASVSTAATTDRSYTASFTGGTNGATETSIPLGKLIKAYDQFKSAEDIDISLLLAGKSHHGGRGMAMPRYLIENIAERRKDCVVLLSPQRSDVVDNPFQEMEDVVSTRNVLPSSSYGIMDSGYKYQYDKYNDLYRYVPMNGDTGGLIVRTDDTRDPWFSPAGFNRGYIKNVARLAYNPDKADRDQLYKAGVNPVVTFPGQGTVLFGDKTLLAKPSAFDRINVRRLFIVLEKAIATASKYTLFEFNDAFTRAQFRNLIEPYLRDVQGRRGIYDFRVVCDETNNTGEVIDRNEFIGDIYIKPARSINFIQLNFVAVRTGVEFEEVVGKF